MSPQKCHFPRIREDSRRSRLGSGYSSFWAYYDSLDYDDVLTSHYLAWPLLISHVQRPLSLLGREAESSSGHSERIFTEPHQIFLGICVCDAAVIARNHSYRRKRVYVY